ncbi:MAG: cytochrome c [Xanthomonadales bacterium]|nr:cytochrome c [Xanthomonadales bacterium]
MKTTLKTFLTIVAPLLLALPTIAIAKGDATAGQKKSATCTACHGENGLSVDPNYPNLAGQYQDYMIKALGDYRSGKRTNVIMANFAGQLNNQDIQDLAAWFSSQKGLQDLSAQ